MIIGIDPGLKGGVAAVDNIGRLLWVRPMPVYNKVIDVVTLQGWADNPNLRMAIEDQGYRPGQAGVKTTLANFGRLLAIPELGLIPYRVVQPAVWNKHFSIPTGLKGAAKKEQSFFTLRARIGDQVEKHGLTKSKDGMVEAVLIALYGYDTMR